MSATTILVCPACQSRFGPSGCQCEVCTNMSANALRHAFGFGSDACCSSACERDLGWLREEDQASADRLVQLAQAQLSEACQRQVCTKHPGFAAVKDGLCVSCLAYKELGEKIKARSA